MMRFTNLVLKMEGFICNRQVFIGQFIFPDLAQHKSMIDNSNNERRPWSQEEDEALKTLYEGLQANRWNLIAQKLQTEYGFTGRSGKQCRQRYNNHLDPALSKDEWSPSEELALFRLHDQLGNKWAVISQRLSTGRTDNTVKNHFYSRLRKSLRRLNKVILEKYKKSMREIRTQVLYKIIEASQQAFKEEPMCSAQLSQLGCELKNRILMVTDEGSELEEESTRALIESVNQFNHIYKRKPKKLRRTSCSYGRYEEEPKFHPPPKLMTFQDKNSRRSSFSSLSHKNSISCLFEDEESAKIEIKSDCSLKVQTQKLISPIILTVNCSSASFTGHTGSKSEQILSSLGLLEQASMANSTRHIELCPESQQLKLLEDSATEVKAEPLGIISPARIFNLYEAI